MTRPAPIIRHSKKVKPHKLRPAHTMNKTEAEWADGLAIRVAAGEIVACHFEALRFRLAANTTYTPDFMVICAEHIEMHEVKGGFFRDDARAKWKIAAEMYPYFRWIWAQKKKGVWHIEVYGE